MEKKVYKLKIHYLNGDEMHVTTYKEEYEKFKEVLSGLYVELGNYFEFGKNLNNEKIIVPIQDIYYVEISILNE